MIKTANVNGVDSGPPAQEDDPNNPDTVPGQQNDPVTYTIVIEHRDPSGATAYDVELFDQIPLEVVSLNLDSAVHSSLGDIAGVNIFLNGRTLETNDTTQDTPFDLAFDETVTITGIEHGLKPRQTVNAEITFAGGTVKSVPLLCRIDTLDELEYFNNGGILHYVLRQLAA